MGKSAVPGCRSIYPGSSRFRQVEVAGDEVRMQVCFQDMSDLKAHPPGRIEVRADVAFRVDYGTGVIPRDHVGAMGDARDEMLVNDHNSHLLSDEQIDEYCCNAYEKHGHNAPRLEIVPGSISSGIHQQGVHLVGGKDKGVLG